MDLENGEVKKGNPMSIRYRNLLVFLAACWIASACNSMHHQPTKSKTDSVLYKPKIQNLHSPNKEVFDETQRYHSAYHTGNPYYDGRNLILDGDIREAIKILQQDVLTLDFPDRGALWVFLSYCKLQQKNKAVSFLEEYLKNGKVDISNKDIMTTMLNYYTGNLDEDEVLKRIKTWDHLDNCAAYYYYGSFKKYYENDIVLGNEYLSRVLKTNIYDYSEYKFAEMEIRGFTTRFPGQYDDYPIVALKQLRPENLSSFLDESSFSYDAATLEELNTLVEDYLDDGNSSTLFSLPENVGEDQFIIPSLDEAGWEVCNEEELLEILQDEARAIVFDLTSDRGYLFLEDLPDYELYPLSNTFKTFAFSAEDYEENQNLYSNQYKINYDEVSFFLEHGNYMGGILIPCRSYNAMLDSYEESADVTLTLIFTVSDDRIVEMTQKIPTLYLPDSIADDE